MDPCKIGCGTSSQRAGPLLLELNVGWVRVGLLTTLYRTWTWRSLPCHLACASCIPVHIVSPHAGKVHSEPTQRGAPRSPHAHAPPRLPPTPSLPYRCRAPGVNPSGWSYDPSSAAAAHARLRGADCLAPAALVGSSLPAHAPAGPASCEYLCGGVRARLCAPLWRCARGCECLCGGALEGVRARPRAAAFVCSCLRILAYRCVPGPVPAYLQKGVPHQLLSAKHVCTTRAPLLWRLCFHGTRSHPTATARALPWFAPHCCRADVAHMLSWHAPPLPRAHRACTCTDKAVLHAHHAKRKPRRALCGDPLCAVRQLSRLCVAASEAAHIQAIASATVVTATYDLLSVAPLSDKVMHQVGTRARAWQGYVPGKKPGRLTRGGTQRCRCADAPDRVMRRFGDDHGT